MRDSTGSALAALIAALILGTGFIVSDQINYHRWDGFEYQSTLLYQAHSRLLSGEFPHWTQNQHMGEPTHAETLAGALYPFYTLCVLLVRVVGLSPSRILDVSAILHTAIAAAGFYLLARRFSVRPVFSIIASISCVFGGYVMYVGAIWGFLLPIFAWMMWAMVAFKDILDAHRVHRAFLLGVASLVLMFAAGHPQHAVYGWLAAGAFAAAYGLVAHSPIKAWCTIAGTLFIAALLAMPCLLPAWELKQLSPRAGKLPYEIFSSRSVNPRSLAGFLLPVYKGSDSFVEYRIICTTYLGAWLLPALVAGWLALFRDGNFWKRHGRLILALTLVGLVFLALSLGRAGGLLGIAYMMPLLSSFRWPFKFLLASTPLLALAGALSLEYLARRHRASGPLLVGVTCAAFAAALWAVRYVDLGWYGITAGVAGLCAMVAIGALDRPAVCVALLVLVLVGTVSLLFIVHHPGRIRSYVNERYASTGAAALGITTDYRVLPISRPWNDDGIMQELSLFDSAMMNGYYSLTGSLGDFSTVEYLEYVPCSSTGILPPGRRASFLRSHLMRSFNTKYVVVSKLDEDGLALMAGLADYNVVHESSNALTYANADALPRAYFASETRPYTEPALMAGMTDNQALLTAAYVEGVTSTNSFVQGKVLGLEWGQNEVRIDVETAEPGYLVVSMTHFPGWTAKVDGRAASLHRSNGAITGLDVPGGARRVILSYQPVAFRWGLVLAGVGVVFLGIAMRTMRREAAA